MSSRSNAGNSSSDHLAVEAKAEVSQATVASPGPSASHDQKVSPLSNHGSSTHHMAAQERPNLNQEEEDEYPFRTIMQTNAAHSRAILKSIIFGGAIGLLLIAAYPSFAGIALLTGFGAGYALYKSISHSTYSRTTIINPSTIHQPVRLAQHDRFRASDLGRAISALAQVQDIAAAPRIANPSIALEGETKAGNMDNVFGGSPESQSRSRPIESVPEKTVEAPSKPQVATLRPLPLKPPATNIYDDFTGGASPSETPTHLNESIDQTIYDDFTESTYSSDTRKMKPVTAVKLKGGRIAYTVDGPHDQTEHILKAQARKYGEERSQSSFRNVGSRTPRRGEITRPRREG